MKNLFDTTTVVGILFTVSGIILRLLIAKRRFERRGPAGLQRFTGFWSALIISFLESVAAAVSVLLMLAGILLLLAGYFS